MKEFLLQGISHRWLVPLIQGYCASFNHLRFLQKNIRITLISRRETARAGPRFFSRGIDDQGNVANFVETELIVEYDNNNALFSHLQIRGSVPLFWSQKPKKTTKVKFKDSRQNYAVLNKHFDSLVRRYGKIQVLNLLKQNDPEEAKLTESMSNLIE